MTAPMIERALCTRCETRRHTVVIGKRRFCAPCLRTLAQQVDYAQARARPLRIGDAGK